MPGMIGSKTKLSEASEKTGTFNHIALVRSISGPNEQMPQVDATTLDSTVREYIAGLPDNGQMAVNCLYTAARGRHKLWQPRQPSRPSIPAHSRRGHNIQCGRD